LDEEERHEDEEQADIVEAARAVSEETLPSLVRRISFRRSMSVPALKSGRTAELAMMSAVLVKRGLRPRRRFSTSCGCDKVGSVGRAGTMLSTWPRRPNLAHMAVKNAFHLE
jgi:hypothetical protein